MVVSVNPMLLEIPDPLETERLRLRSPRAGDGPMITAAIAESLDALQRWMPWAQGGQPVEQSEIVARQMAVAFIRRESLTYRLLRKDDEQFVGMCSLFNFVWDVPSGEIGYWLRTAMQGQGYITEAVNCLTQLAFETLGLQRLEIRCEAANMRSAAVARRAGYTLEARLRNHRRNPLGDLADTLIHAQIASDNDNG